MSGTGGSETSGGNEAALVKRARNGDMAAFRQIVESHSHRVYGLAYRIIGNADDAQDIAQEVFVKVYGALSRFDPGYLLSTWLYRITVNLAIDYRRKQQRRRQSSIEAADKLQSISGPDRHQDSPAVQSQLRLVVAGLASRLSPKQERVFVLRDLEGYSIAEIAQIVKCRESTVRVHLARARSRIRDELLRNYPELLEGRAP